MEIALGVLITALVVAAMVGPIVAMANRYVATGNRLMYAGAFAWLCIDVGLIAAVVGAS